MRRAIILAHYDRHGVVDPHVAAAIRKYRRCADRLVMVSTAERRPTEGVPADVDVFVHRPNVGYDFSSWRAGLATLGGLDRFDEVICVNDSVYGPLWSLDRVFDSPRIAAADFWGMVLSEHGPKARRGRPSPHLQSWFFAMRRPLLASRAFARFWETVAPQPDKDAVIERYELGMTEQFLRAGFALAAVYDARDRGALGLTEILPHLSWREPARSWRHLRKAPARRHNPSILAWQRLLDAGVPYVKVDLFRRNAYAVDLARVHRHLASLPGCDTDVIRSHLARIA